jgi:pimeloyl-ACP methyl ester carboxylesterase
MREQRFDLEGTSLFARCWGGDAGPVVLLWHGLGLRASMVFNELVGTLARRVPDRFVAIDAPGFGRSPALRSDVYRTQTLVDLSVKVLDHLCCADALWLGWSWGAGLGCHVAAQHPSRVTGLALLDGGYRDVQPPQDRSWEGYQFEARQGWEEACGTSWQQITALLQARSRRWSPAIEAAWRSGWHEMGGRLVPTVQAETFAAAQRAVIDSPPSSTWGRLGRSQVPVLLLAAEEAPIDALEQFASAVPQTEIHRVAGAGHDVATDAPAEVAAHLTSWLNEQRRS